MAQKNLPGRVHVDSLSSYISERKRESLRPQGSVRARRAKHRHDDMRARLIIGERGEREEGKKSVDRLIQSNLGGRREGTAVLETKREHSRS